MLNDINKGPLISLSDTNLDNKIMPSSMVGLFNILQL